MMLPCATLYCGVNVISYNLNELSLLGLYLYIQPVLCSAPHVSKVKPRLLSGVRGGCENGVGGHKGIS